MKMQEQLAQDTIVLSVDPHTGNTMVDGKPVPIRVQQECLQLTHNKGQRITFYENLETIDEFCCRFPPSKTPISLAGLFPLNSLSIISTVL
jgi:hypothetical protein